MSLDPTDWNKRMDPNFGTNWRAKTTKKKGACKNSTQGQVRSFDGVTILMDLHGRLLR